MLTHKNFCSDARALISAGIVTHEDNVLSILPLHHTYAFMCTFLVPLLAWRNHHVPSGMKGPETHIDNEGKGGDGPGGGAPAPGAHKKRHYEEVQGDAHNGLCPAPPFLRIGGGLRKGMDINPGKILFASAHKAFGDRFRFFASGRRTT